MRRLLEKFSFKQTGIGVADPDVSISTYQTVCMGTVLVFVFGDVKNARDLHLQLRQAAHFVVNEVPGW